ncbi:ricin B lectin domain-containing protein [Jimgerdemannia flammicorona]|uniref:Ricin B lectin domain-containing protein n=1 Tax=Jimgerdemannia flammicorona TaxID=994334 RepID=A0A433DNB3_9FUNG|nr:ricin B lectin domain-containing protein [Jimgerdemannia flammicorona]
MIRIINNCFDIRHCWTFKHSRIPPCTESRWREIFIGTRFRSTVSSVNTTTSLFQSSIASSLYTTSPIEEFPKGYFYIKSKKNGMVLDVEGDSIKPNARVIVWPQKFRGNANQLWTYDDGYLVNKNSELGLTALFLSDLYVVQSERKPIEEAQHQRWNFCEEGFFYSLHDPHLVLDIRGDSNNQGAHILLYKRKDNDNYNQLWTIEPYPY